MRLENERLRLALGQAMTGTRKFEDEIQALKMANLRLTGAVQESESNAEDWKKQMMLFKEECVRLKNNTSNGSSNSAIAPNNMNHATGKKNKNLLKIS